MVWMESPFALYASLFLPLKGEHPMLLMDEDLRIRQISSLAVSLPLSQGDNLRDQLSEAEQQRHESCCRREKESGFHPLNIPQCSLFTRLREIPGYPYLLLEYAYTPRHILIRGTMFRSRRAYLQAVRSTERGAAFCVERLSREIPSRRMELRDLLQAEEQGEDAEFLETRLCGACSALHCLSADAAESDSAGLFCISTVLHAYREMVLEELGFADCRVIWEPRGKMVCARLEPKPFFLMLSALFSVLNALSENRTIRVTYCRCGTETVLTFETENGELARRMLQTEDLQTLLAYIPQKRFSLTMTEYMLGFCGFPAILSGDADRQTITVTVYLPDERLEREFKAPEDEQECLIAAAEAGRGYLLLADP